MRFFERICLSFSYFYHFDVGTLFALLPVRVQMVFIYCWFIWCPPLLLLLISFLSHFSGGLCACVDFIHSSKVSHIFCTLFRSSFHCCSYLAVESVHVKYGQRWMMFTGNWLICTNTKQYASVLRLIIEFIHCSVPIDQFETKTEINLVNIE